VTASSYVISKELVKRGHEVTVFTTDVGNDPYSRLNVRDVNTLDGITVYYFKNISNILAFKHRILTPWKMLPALVRNIHRYDIVHINGLRNIHDIMAFFCAKNYDVPYIQQSHGDIPRIMAKKRLKWLIDVSFSYSLIKNAQKVIALNRWEAEQYKRIGVPEEKIAIIPNGINLSEYAELPPKGLFKRKFNIPESKKVILYLNRIDKIKGTDILVKTYAHLVKKMGYKDAILAIAGPDEGFLNEVKSIANALNVSDSIIFTGPLYGKNKLQAYVDSDVYLLSSRYETFPMTILEAYACSKPVIAFDVGGLKDLVIDRETGFLVEFGEVEKLAKSILNILNDENMAIRMGLRGKKFLKENFTIEKVVTSLEKIYNEVVSL
jgi:glycosyltransferase involved in cell wall biosynthesis